MVQLRDPLIRRPRALHDLALPQHKPRDDATCRHWFPPEPNPGFEKPQTWKPSTVVLRPKPPNRPRVAYSICSPHELDTCHRRPRPLDHQVSSSASVRLAQPPSWLGQHGHSHVLLHLSMTLGVSHPRSVTLLLRSLGPSHDIFILLELISSDSVQRPSQTPWSRPDQGHVSRSLAVGPSRAVL
jgi:hypothetical protein